MKKRAPSPFSVTPLRAEGNDVKKDTVATTPSATKGKGISNMAIRAITCLTVAPAILAFGMYSKWATTAIVFFAISVGGIEWAGLKRHLKVALLIGPGDNLSPKNSVSADGLTDSKSSAETDGHPLHPLEYALPVVPLSFYNILKHLFWACLSIAAYYGERAFIVTFTVFFLTLVMVTLTAHNGLEVRMGEAVAKLRTQRRSSPPAPRGDKDALKRAQRKYFLDLELKMIAGRQPTEQFLDFCLDIFGILWLAGATSPLFVYSIPAVGVPWIFSTMVGNFTNDIMALLVGRALNSMRMKYNSEDAVKKEGASEPGVFKRFVLAGPRPLYKAISPNKSLEGAIAGITSNAFFFTACMCFFHFLQMPEENVMSARFLTVPVWLAIGSVMGMFGVMGDLLQSLLKRSAHVKDAGFIIPGHGGVLDRIDGLLLTLPFMHCIMCVLMGLSAATVSM